MSIRDVHVWLSALVLIGTPAVATASCDISGSSVIFQGIEKRDGASARTQTLERVLQKPTQSKAESREAPPSTGSKPEQTTGTQPAVLRRD